MSISGFDQSESCGLKRLLRALGITLAPTFTRRSTILLCPSGTGLKYEKAQEWGVPVVGMEWLKEMATSGRIPEVEKHVVDVSAKPPPAEKEGLMCVAGDMATNEESGLIVTEKVLDKGKGKAMLKEMDDAAEMDVDPQMHDVSTSKLPPRFSKASDVLIPDIGAVERLATTTIPHLESPERQPSVPGIQNRTIEGRTVSSYLEELRQYSSLPQTAVPSRHQSVTMSLIDAQVESLTMSGLSERQPTVLDLGEVDRSQEGRVPSSKSPSPMKVLSQRSGSRHSLSPEKIDHDATKALQESIASLLGKRPSPDGDELAVGADGKSGPAGRSRNSKRVRPRKSKVLLSRHIHKQSASCCSHSGSDAASFECIN